MNSPNDPGTQIQALQEQIKNLELAIDKLGSEKARKSGFLSEDNGNKSSMRLMCFTSLIAAIVFGALTISLSSRIDNGNKPDTSTGIYITFSFLLGAFAPKALQKFAETPAFGSNSNSVTK